MFSQRHLSMTRPADFGWSSKRFASPDMGIFAVDNAYCMQTRPLFLRISVLSGVLKALLLERNRQLSCNPQKKKKPGQHHSLNSHDQLQESHAQAVSAISPVHVISWDPSRPWRGPARQPARAAVALYSQGQLWGPNHLSLGVWGWGQRPTHQLIVRQASQR